MKRKLQQLCDKLGYQFQDLTLLDQSLTHRSVSSTNNNERLEFLGDSLVNFIIGEALYEQFPNATEGQLTRLRAHFVRGETCYELAEAFGIGDYLNLGQGELKSGGAKRPSILADAFEAIIAAIYLEAGIFICRERVRAWYQERLSQAALKPHHHKDSKSELQEYVQSKGYVLPIYKVLETKGKSHSQIFLVECYIPSLILTTQGEANSRRKAEQEAANAALKKLKN